MKDAQTVHRTVRVALGLMEALRGSAGRRSFHRPATWSICTRSGDASPPLRRPVEAPGRAALSGGQKDAQGTLRA